MRISISFKSMPLSIFILLSFAHIPLSNAAIYTMQISDGYHKSERLGINDYYTGQSITFTVSDDFKEAYPYCTPIQCTAELVKELTLPSSLDFGSLYSTDGTSFSVFRWGSGGRYSAGTATLTATHFSFSGERPFYDETWKIEASVVPLPASLWFFGSSLLGLFGIKKAKSFI